MAADNSVRRTRSARPRRVGGTRPVSTPIVACAVLAAALWSAPTAFAQQAPAKIMVGPVEYKKLDSRRATEQRMMGLLFPDTGRWGEWYLLTPFPYHDKKGPHLADAFQPESQLDKMTVNGPGPDLTAHYDGKNGTDISWRPIGDVSNRAVELALYEIDDLNTYAQGYLYGTVEADKPITMDVTMGSDDGLRFWLNGRLLVDKDVLRGLDPEEDKVRLDFRPGVNHILVKVSQKEGGFQYQINNRPQLDPAIEAQLIYHLNKDFPLSPEDEYYKALTIPTPENVVLEVGGLDVLPPAPGGECRPIVSTRRGEIYIVEGAYDDPPFNAKFKRFATGLHEPLGLAVRLDGASDGNPHVAVYVVQRGELTKLVDTDGDDVADVYETVCADWGVSGNYHEFAFGPKFDKDGNAWVTLNVGFCGSLGKSIVPWRGWALKVTPDGTMIPVCDGLRSPNGIGMYSDGAMFYLDNQGDYVGTNRMSQLKDRSWAGHPSTLGWRRELGWEMKPDRIPATVWFPYPETGQSAADFLLYKNMGQKPWVDASLDASKFGPFEGQVFVGDQTLCYVNRVDLEKIDGLYQGAVFPFRQGLDCGVNRLAWGGDGSMFVGETDRGWGSIGRLRYGLQRLVWTGKLPFEMQHMRAAPDGFVLTFTKDVDPATAADPASYAMISYTYEYHATYGSGEMDTKPVKITGADVVDARTVRLRTDALRSGDMGYVHELTAAGVKDREGKPLLHNKAFYTLQRIPKDPPALGMAR